LVTVSAFLKLDVDPVVYKHRRSQASGGEKGGKGASAPGGTVQGAAFKGAKIRNSEIWA